MVVEKVSVDRVKAKLALLSQKKKGHVPLQPAMRPKLEEFGEDDDDSYQVKIEPSKRQKK